ncbi:MAG: UPF0182 family protein [Candidatus Latescibacteria bacterium]|nr:UPF0182 family protein [Candidatus Latescibacterota bacterium]
MQRKFLIPVVFALVLGLGWVSSYYTDWLWFSSLDYQGVFWGTLKARFFSGVFYGLFAAVIVGLNLLFVSKFTRQALEAGGTPFEGEFPGEGLLRSPIGYVLIGAVLVLILGNVGSSQWPTVLRYWHGGDFGASDPIFGKEVGFYVFDLPLYQFTIGFLIACVVVSAIASAVIYIAAGGIRIQERIQLMPRPVAHLSVLGGLFLLFSAVNYRLKIYDLLYSQNNVFFGAGYVDVNVQVWVYWFLVAAFVVTGVMVLRNVKTREARPLIMGLGVFLVGAIGLGNIPGAIIQKVAVDPTELEREAPYIKHNIDVTRQAYALDRVVEKPFAASENLTAADIEANPLTIRNVRIWDQPPMAQTFQQVQEIRPYYIFPNVDVGRYTIDGVYSQVMLSGRELDTNRLPAQARNWVNEKLQYTHGYGVAMSPVTTVTPEGLPEFLIKDLPPVSSSKDLEITQPGIYYGERTYGNVIVKTGAEEFDYPRLDGNAFTTYEGTGGVPIGSLIQQLAFAVRMMDVNLLLSTYIKSDSRIMFRRQIVQRAREIAPFLFFDSDPYMVVSEGRLFWILDAYTSTNMYPYSTRMGRSQINYIRNSVKIVVDAYNGAITFYQAEQEPLVNTYAAMFPTLFTPLSEMSADLRTHLRYPVDLFRIQATMYKSYHMQDVQLFYNQEDLWEIPNEIYSDRPQMMEPYYIIVKLPGEDREEFLLMVPFTPAKKDNMIGWLAARCDGENYGDLLVYTLPKEKLIFGPMQLEARIDQQPDISSQLTLWGQRGSEVIRGNLLAIPIESSFLYVEPIYLQARQESEPQQQFGQEGGGQQQQQQQAPQRPNRQSTAIPELKQVIVAYGGQVIMRDTFEDALNDLFGSGAGRTLVQEEGGAQPASGMPQVIQVDQTAVQLANEADRQYQLVRESMQKWDWSKAGDAMKALEKSIQELKTSLEK